MRKLLHFSAPWCGPCRMMHPLILQFVEENKDKLEYEYINIDDDPTTTKYWAVQSVPTFIVEDMQTLEEKGRIVGATTKKKLQDLVDKP